MTKIENIIKVVTNSDYPSFEFLPNDAVTIPDCIRIAKEYAEFCCEQQKIICAIPRHITNPNITTRYYSEESILNSPTYKEEDGK
jgi:hypothetical protein